MTCFWNGILKSLNKNDFKLYFNINIKPNIINFIKLLKNNNRLTKNIMWNGKKLSLIEMKENYNAIKNYNINKINNGHLCSTCDYFLLLISEIFEVNINHNYMKTKINYKNCKKSRRILKFYSNRGHFWS